MRILVIGRTGQVARELDRTVWPAGWTVACRGRDVLDLARPGSVLEPVMAFRPALVINAAACTAVDRAESEPQHAFAVNRDGAAAVAAAAARIRAPVIHLSTDYVFSGDRTAGGYAETDPTGPRSVYGASKLAGEIAVRDRQPDSVILRTSWVFSAHGANFVRTMLRLGAERPEIRVVNDQTGCPTAAADIAATVVILARRILDGTAPSFGVLNLCGTGPVTWFGFAGEIFRQAGRCGCPVPSLVPIATSDWPAAAPRPTRSVLDCARIAALHGIVPRPWQVGLSEVLAQLLPSSSEQAA